MAGATEQQKTFAQLVAAGVPEMKAAGQCGLSPNAARVVLRSPLFKALVEKERTELVGPLLERTRKILEEAVPEALQTIVALSKTAKTESVRFNAAQAILSWTKAIPKEEKAEAGITIVIEGEAAGRLQALSRMLPAIDIAPTAVEVITMIQRREDEDGEGEGGIP